MRDYLYGLPKRIWRPIRLQTKYVNESNHENWIYDLTDTYKIEDY